MPFQPPKCCVVIPIHNRSSEVLEYMERAFRSLAEYVSCPFVVVAVDNASPLEPRVNEGLLRGLGIEDFRIILLDENIGFGPACNRGFEVAYAENIPYVCQMNTDVELVEDSISILIEQIETHNLAVAMPEHYDACRHYNLDKADVLMGSDWRFGAFWVAPSKVIAGVGGFDPAFEMCYFEDTDLWKRIEQTGGHVAGWRGTWVKHKGGVSTIPERDTHFRHNQELYESRWGST